MFFHTSLHSVQNSQQKLGVVAKPQTDVENHYDISQDNFGEVLGSTSYSMAVYMRMPNQSSVPLSLNCPYSSVDLPPVSQGHENKTEQLTWVRHLVTTAHH